MLRLINFLKKTYVLLLFVLLEVLSLHFYASSTSYTRSQLLAASNRYVGWIHSSADRVGHYFYLGRENRALSEELARLRNELASYETDPTKVHIATGEIASYQYLSARVVGNSTTKQDNFLTLNRGMRDDVEASMAVISPEGGIVGYVLSCSDKFAACISVLNREFRTSGRVKGTDYVGSVWWDGVDRERVMLSDIPRYADLHKGDTVVTSSLSVYFPPDVPVGTVEDWTLDEQTYNYHVRVNLATRMAALREVVLVRYMDAAERSALENSMGY
ncbi:MAG: rod shape-determining protein MreC [Rikenellaceae bacterium]|nr:rod shape-determining protein MreC [Rikenellaceae bacterium]